MTIPLVPSTAAVDDVSTISAATVNSWRANMAKAGDFVGGSVGTPYAPATTIDIAGSGLKLSGSGSDGRLKYGSRSIARTQSGIMFDSSGAIATQAALVVAAGATGTQMFDRIPNGSTLTDVTVYVNRTNLGTLPTTRVALTVRKRSSSTGTQSIITGPTVDPTATLAAYEAHHAITISGLSEVIDTTDFVYWVELNGESGANTTTVAQYAAIVTVTVTDQDEAP